MSKKKFSEGLDDLFKDLPSEQGAWDQHPGDSPRERKAASKNFMHDLDMLLQEAMDESLSNLESGTPAPAQSNKSKSVAAHRAPISGLDALIRQTIDVREIVTDEETGKKRLTVAVDKTKLEKLKTIARLENSYLKDILLQLIDEYIQEYTRQKGIDV
ncbi:MAG: hypothetical protein IT260_23480 [Saprospiraceae bacterium]|nr:hypothetical protein [Saprospiraceae bacterium]